MKNAHEKIEAALKSAFRPEFLNRIDDIIMFSPLTKENVRDIVMLQVKEIQGRLAEFGVALDVTEAARDWLADQGFDPLLGARPLKRALQKYVESPLAQKLLSGDFAEVKVVRVDKPAEGTGLEFTRGDAAQAPQPAEEKDVAASPALGA